MAILFVNEVLARPPQPKSGPFETRPKSSEHGTMQNVSGESYEGPKIEWHEVSGTTADGCIGSTVALFLKTAALPNCILIR